MQVIANSKPFSIQPGTSLPQFIESLGLKPGRVIVERNGLALTQTEAASTLLEEGDKLEIVRIVAGG